LVKWVILTDKGGSSQGPGYQMDSAKIRLVKWVTLTDKGWSSQGPGYQMDSAKIRLVCE
jgi:hypothetical protein